MTTDAWDADSLVQRYDEVRAHTEQLAAAPVARGPDGPVDAGRVADEVAPRPCHVVLRDVRARRPRAGFRAVPGQVLVPVQQLLRDGRSALLASAPRSHQPAGRQRRGRLPRQRRRPHARPARRPSTRAPSTSSRRSSSSASTMSSSTRSCCSWTSSTCCRSTRCARSTPAARAPAAEPDALGWVDVEGGLVEVGHAGEGFHFDNEQPRHMQSGSSPTVSPTGSSPTRSGWSSWPTAGTGGTSCGCRTAGRKVNSRGLAGAVLLGRASTVCGSSTRLHGTWPVDPGTAGEPRELLRGRGVRDAGPASGCRPRPSGSTPWSPRVRSMRRPRATSPTPRRSTRGRRARARAACGRSTATAGSGRRRRTSLTRVSTRPQARSASTTASSCPTRWCCAAAARSRRRATRARPTATSSRPRARWALSGVRLADGGAPYRRGDGGAP